MSRTKRNRINGLARGKDAESEKNKVGGTSFRSGSLILLAILLAVTISVAGIANWRGLRASSRAAALMPNPTPPPLPANAPAKEFVYAGSSLISTVETFRPPPSDLAIYRPSTGVWWITTAQSWVALSWGASTDLTAQADFDGDGKTDLSVFRPSDGVWYIIRSTDSGFDFRSWGGSGDKPVPADFDGDGLADLAIWKAADSAFYVSKSSGGTFGAPIGTSNDVPVPSDYS